MTAEDLPLNQFLAAARTPLIAWPESYPDHRAIGYTCTYVPEEMIHAAGFVPVRIRTTPQVPIHADAHLQSYTCALCRSALDQHLRGELHFLAGMVFAHTCDTMQALADLWAINTRLGGWVETFMMPVNLTSPNARPYLIAELARFRSSLAERSGCPVSDEALKASIALYNEKRRLLDRLHVLRDRLTAVEFYATVDAGAKMPPELFVPLLAELVEDLESAPSRPGSPRVMLVGAVLDDATLLAVLDELGARVADDDLCTGTRSFAGHVAEEGDPLEAMADRILNRLPCPTKYHTGMPRGTYLRHKVEEAGADGVIFVLPKFCDPHAFDYVLVKADLEAAGVPLLHLETEQTPAAGQVRTRVQAFLEMLSE
ncbi:MAG: 2-hydroxyacyl-CoA dehydratase family protein [Anaerolineae bacterium]|jgi:bcr-type benzoyl-CoA reductase subunit C|nr:2-hydroxyacyl-CoA dehydratase family protein [Anaerolineae bacterium]MDH7474069.1 2-hydroxyacyl-CoA dehydratase family protein [Anaerolineae bacterium]